MYKIGYAPFGYDVEDGVFSINEAEAETVRFIYTEVSGKRSSVIARDLNERGVSARKGAHWTSATIRNVLTNKKYIGYALLQKIVTTDFLTKERVVNKGIVPQYYVENSHEAIIPREIFMQVKEEMARRANISTGTGKRRVYSSHYALSSIVYCAHCGDLFRRISWNNRGKKSVVWRCVSSTALREAHRNGQCDLPSPGASSPFGRDIRRT
ncbi:MAG: recombinase family protein [Lachnospiraceae bacterium]|nr:recombinase family protein [Lachnospiraceae bacterium]